MTRLLWAALGMTLGAAVLHGALGLKRPLERAYLSFACIMALLAIYVYFEWELYRTTTSEAAVELVRRQVVAADGFLAAILVFVPAYTHARIPRLVMAAYGAALAILFVANLATPYGVWFSGPPELVRLVFRGEPYTAVIAPPMSLLQYAHALYVLSLFVLTFGCAIKLFVRGERQRGATLAIALVGVVLYHVADVVREAVSGSWPYVAEFGLVTWGLVMSVQLAIDFRVSTQRLSATLKKAEQGAVELAAAVDATLELRDKLNTPLQILELGLPTSTARTLGDERMIAGARSRISPSSVARSNKPRTKISAGAGARLTRSEHDDDRAVGCAWHDGRRGRVPRGPRAATPTR